jgi:hypothetical protein
MTTKGFDHTKSQQEAECQLTYLDEHANIHHIKKSEGDGNVASGLYYLRTSAGLQGAKMETASPI